MRTLSIQKRINLLTQAVEPIAKLTLVMGANCVDGVAIIGDKKFVNRAGEFLENDEKLSGVLRHVIFGFAGSKTMFEIFNKYVYGDAFQSHFEGNPYLEEGDKLIQRLAPIIEKINSVSCADELTLRILVGRQFPKTERLSELYYIDIDGSFKLVEYHAIGEGRVTANRMLERQRVAPSKLKMSQFAEYSCFLIKYLEEHYPELHTGSYPEFPSVRYMEHKGEDDKEPKGIDLQDLRERVKRRLERMNLLDERSFIPFDD